MPEEDVFALQAFILVKKYTYKQSHVTCSVCSIYFILCVLGVSHAKAAVHVFRTQKQQQSPTQMGSCEYFESFQQHLFRRTSATEKTKRGREKKRVPSLFEVNP